jgi:hypothetical protein
VGWHWLLAPADVGLLTDPARTRRPLQGKEHLDQTKTPKAVMVANHQSALDAFIFGDLWRVNFRVRIAVAAALTARSSGWVLAS